MRMLQNSAIPMGIVQESGRHQPVIDKCNTPYSLPDTIAARQTLFQACNRIYLIQCQGNPRLLVAYENTGNIRQNNEDRIIYHVC
jgi:hypothetical protein